MDGSPALPSLFDPVVPEDRLHPSFRLIREGPAHSAARVVMDRVFRRMGDRDGNFRQQFQSDGFDARVWELYLYAALEDAGYQVTQPGSAPDFVLRSDEFQWSVEATTANLRPGEDQPDFENSDELLAFLADELPIRLGSPLFTKLQREYEELPHVEDKPFVLGLECFVTSDGFFFSERTVTEYLFGLRSHPERRPDGSLAVRSEPVTEHRVGDKVVPSGFFEQPEARGISAVIYSNSGTVPKFNRMGFQDGLGLDQVWLGRFGFCGNPDPDADRPTVFSYEVGTRREVWGEGLVVIHNPHARHPLPDAALRAGIQYRRVGDEIRHTLPPFHPFGSKTLTVIGEQASPQGRRERGLPLLQEFKAQLSEAG